MKKLFVGLVAVVSVMRVFAEAHDHAYENGICSVEGCTDKYQPVVQSDGIYKIANAGQLCSFAEMVNKADGATCNAELTADIDLSPIDNFPTIGKNLTHYYHGVFDGKGHAITNVKIKSNSAYVGFFPALAGDTTVKDFSISGSLVAERTDNATYVGLIGILGSATTFTIEDIHCSLAISDSGANKTGGILGGCQQHEMTVSFNRCWFDGVIDRNDKTIDCCAGIAGYLFHSARLDNCLYTGQIINTGDPEATTKKGNIGGMIGWINNGGFRGLYNCFSMGSITRGAGANVGALTGGYRRNGSGGYTPEGKYDNNYYTKTAGSTTTNKNPDHDYDGVESVDWTKLPTRYADEDAAIYDGTLLKALGTANWQQATFTPGSYPVPGTHLRRVCPHPASEGVTDGRCNLCGGPGPGWLELSSAYGVSTPEAGLTNPVPGVTTISLESPIATDEVGLQHRCCGYALKGVKYELADPEVASVTLSAEQMACGVEFEWLWEDYLHKHEYDENGFCFQRCAAYAQPCDFVDDAYLIANPGNFQWFAEKVNAKQAKLNAKLTKDIDLKVIANFPVIGTNASPYSGTFDGQGHTISNLAITSEALYCGLFGRVASSDTVIKNFSVTGTIDAQSTLGTSYAGTIAYASSTAKLTIEDVHSSVTITSAGEKNKVGGIFGGDGGSGNLTVTIDRCWFDGVIDKGSSQVDCLAGICSYVYGHTEVKNCLFSGTIKDSTGGNNCGGIFGYVNTPYFKGVHNCLSMGTIGTGASRISRIGAIYGWCRMIGESANQEANYYTETAAANATNKTRPYDGGNSDTWGEIKPTCATTLGDGSVWLALGRENWHQHYPVSGGKSFPAPGAGSGPRGLMVIIK